ncbi:unnamed protein product [Plutella xylostella]|uniref:(diamondback moth) hypothetical protein n=1 Tax=Plutella xylostella TaxID=51655 RepID=A0A8S4DYM2_PLUXY|nr:unnamed protein product [Plutella xylostella]
MPQIFQVLRCYKCSVFQVHQTKKSNKFECKMCGEKQSIKRHYGIGNAKECRGHVQKLNVIRGEVDLTEISNSIIDTDDDDDYICDGENITNSSESNKIPSKWSNYVESKTNDIEENNTEFLNNCEVVLEIPKKRPRMNYQATKKHKKCSKNLSNSDDDNDSFSDSNKNNRHEIQKNKENVSTIERKAIFVPPILNHHCKPEYGVILNDNDTNYSNTSSDNVSKENTNLVNKSPKLQIMSSSSKWAQYVDDCENHDIDDELLEEDKPANGEKAEKSIDNWKKTDGATVQELFSQCDDRDWDDILNF